MRCRIDMVNEHQSIKNINQFCKQDHILEHVCSLYIQPIDVYESISIFVSKPSYLEYIHPALGLNKLGHSSLTQHHSLKYTLYRFDVEQSRSLLH
jgi:hypothetical protein